MSIAPDEEDELKAVLYFRAHIVQEMLSHYDGHNLSPYQRAQLLNYLGIEENGSQQPCLPDKDAPNYI